MAKERGSEVKSVFLSKKSKNVLRGLQKMAQMKQLLQAGVMKKAIELKGMQDQLEKFNLQFGRAQKQLPPDVRQPPQGMDFEEGDQIQGLGV